MCLLLFLMHKFKWLTIREKKHPAVHHSTVHCMKVILPLGAVCRGCEYDGIADGTHHHNAHNECKEHFLLYCRYNEVQGSKGLLMITRKSKYNPRETYG